MRSKHSCSIRSPVYFIFRLCVVFFSCYWLFWRIEKRTRLHGCRSHLHSCRCRLHGYRYRCRTCERNGGFLEAIGINVGDFTELTDILDTVQVMLLRYSHTHTSYIILFMFYSILFIFYSILFIFYLSILFLKLDPCSNSVEWIIEIGMRKGYAINSVKPVLQGISSWLALQKKYPKW